MEIEHKICPKCGKKFNCTKSQSPDMCDEDFERSDARRRLPAKSRLATRSYNEAHSRTGDKGLVSTDERDRMMGCHRGVNRGITRCHTCVFNIVTPVTPFIGKTLVPASVGELIRNGVTGVTVSHSLPRGSAVNAIRHRDETRSTYHWLQSSVADKASVLLKIGPGIARKWNTPT
jgi:hypothetical protein